MNNMYDKIKRLRLEKGLSQDELAEKVGYTHRSSIGKVESGLVDLPQSKIQAFAEALGTTTSYLMGWETTKEDRALKIQHINLKYFFQYLKTQSITFDNFFEDYFKKFNSSRGWNSHGDESYANVDELIERYAHAYYEHNLLSASEVEDFNQANKFINFDLEEEYNQFSLENITNFLCTPSEILIEFTSNSISIEEGIFINTFYVERDLELMLVNKKITNELANKLLSKNKEIRYSLSNHFDKNFDEDIENTFGKYKNTYHSKTSLSNEDMFIDYKSAKEGNMFLSAQEAFEFIIKQPTVAMYGGYDLEKMSDEELIEFANDLANMLTIISKKYNK